MKINCDVVDVRLKLCFPTKIAFDMNAYGPDSEKKITIH